MGRSTKKALRVVELFILGVFFGLVPIAAVFMVAVLFASIAFGKESLGPWILWFLLPGVFIDVLFLKKWVRNAYIMSAKTIGAMYVFYSVCAIGFFMGIPVGNILLGVFAGIYAGRKASVNNQVQTADYFKKTAFFTSAVMVLICCLMTLLAIVGDMIGYEVEVPISFTLTVPLFWTVVFTGGALLVLLQYWLTRITAKVTFSLKN